MVLTKHFRDQRPGTSGLRKRVTVFQQPHYVENFIQSILNMEPKATSLVVGGDGRYYNDVVIQKILSVCLANNISRLIIAKDGILSTPAASTLVREMKTDGAIILTASHNPGGPKGDLGIKYNLSNGGPAPDWWTEELFAKTCEITYYRCLVRNCPDIDISTIGNTSFGCTKIDIVDGVYNHIRLLESIFDFDVIRDLLVGTNETKPMKILVDCMNGVMGPYAKHLFVNILGAPESSIINATPLEDFGGKHPDPNLTYATELVERMKADPEIKMGAAFDGDGDRHMILGEGAFFVTPGDSLAIICANLKRIRHYNQRGFKGFARSFPTSPAVDRVAQHFGLSCYVTPTGWKYFGNLLDHELISVCGEESFGIGSEHIREKDGLWAVLAWLNVMGYFSRGVKSMTSEHWRQFGRDYFCRYDYEECDSKASDKMMSELNRLLAKKSLVGKKFGHQDRYKVSETGDYNYHDPVERTFTLNHGSYIKCVPNGKIVFRLSGTGSTGATVRLYLTDFSRDKLDEDPQEFLKDLLDFALSVSKLAEFTGRTEPTVIT